MVTGDYKILLLWSRLFTKTPWIEHKSSEWAGPSGWVHEVTGCAPDRCSASLAASGRAGATGRLPWWCGLLCFSASEPAACSPALWWGERHAFELRPKTKCLVTQIITYAAVKTKHWPLNKIFLRPQNSSPTHFPEARNWSSQSSHLWAFHPTCWQLENRHSSPRCTSGRPPSGAPSGSLAVGRQTWGCWAAGVTAGPGPGTAEERVLRG